MKQIMGRIFSSDKVLLLSCGFMYYVGCVIEASF